MITPGVTALLAACLLVSGVKGQFPDITEKADCLEGGGGSVYNYPIRIGITGEVVDWNLYRGSVVLVVNVASFSEWTMQYLDLNVLQSRYTQFRILAAPTNYFFYEEPGTAQEIMNTIHYVRPGNNYLPNFNLTEKVGVNGPTSHPIFTFLRTQCKSPRRPFSPKDSLIYDGIDPDDIRWNFEKFLLYRAGVPVRRYRSNVEPLDIAQDIERLLAGLPLVPVMSQPVNAPAQLS